MLGITAIVWQSYYNLLYKASKKIKEFSINVYSARSLEKDPLLMEKVSQAIKNSQILFLYRSNEAIWEEIEKIIKKNKGKNYLPWA